MIATVDHVVPHVAGGTITVDNLVACCQPCNFLKGSAVVETIGQARAVVTERRAELVSQYVNALQQYGYSLGQRTNDPAWSGMVSLAAVADVLRMNAETIAESLRVVESLANRV